jgi:hypothetical protein
MSDEHPSQPITVPPPEEIRRRLRASIAESRALRQLLKLAEAACKVKECRDRRDVPPEGGPDAA